MPFTLHPRLAAGTLHTLDQADALGDLSAQTGVAVADPEEPEPERHASPPAVVAAVRRSSGFAPAARN